MKKYIILLLLPLSFTACKKENEPEPEPAAQVAGNYQMTYLSIENTGTPRVETTLPYVVGGQTLASGTITVTRQTENTVNASALLKVQGQADQNPNFQNIEVRKNGSSYDLYSGTTKLGTADGTNVEIDTQTSPTQKVILRAKKQ